VNAPQPWDPRPQPVQPGQGMPTGAGANGQPGLNPDELRRAVRKWWHPRHPVPEGTSPQLAAQYKEDWELDVAEQARTMVLRSAAQRELDAQGWQTPADTADLAAELKLPRSGEPHRVSHLAGIAHNVLVAGPRKTGKTQLLDNLAGLVVLPGPLRQRARVGAGPDHRVVVALRLPARPGCPYSRRGRTGRRGVWLCGQQSSLLRSLVACMVKRY
jgi:hypothetical protein